MSRLKWVPVIVGVLLFVLTGTTVLYGRGLPVSGDGDQFTATWLNMCGQRLCLYKVTPGTTTWSEAKVALADYITRDMGDHFHGRAANREIRVEVALDGDLISRIDVQESLSNLSPISFSQVIAQYGMPCSVDGVTYRNDGLVLNYPSFKVLIIAKDSRITPESLVGGVTLTSISLDPANRSCTDVPDMARWRGFTSLYFYRYMPSRQMPASYFGR